MRREVTELLVHNAEHARRLASRFDDVQDVRRPTSVTVCCSDSRVLQDHTWGSDEPGRLFTCSDVGNRVGQRPDADDVVSGDLLYPIVHTGTVVVVVVGHTGRGAITAAYDDLTDGVSDPAWIADCLDLLASRLERGLDLLPPDVSRTGAVNRLSSTTSTDGSTDSGRASTFRNASRPSGSSPTSRTSTPAVEGRSTSSTSTERRRSGRSVTSTRRSRDD